LSKCARALRLAHDELLVGPTTPTGHDPLRHYTAAATTDDWLVFGNGDGRRTAVLGAARPSRAARQTTNVMTLTVSSLEPGEAVLLTTYQSDGKTVSVGEPFEEATVKAVGGEELADEVWSALTPEFRVAAVVLDPLKGPAAALLRSA
jgi:hypothetical protein